ncbi:hypothetical protein BDZ89DRAFT_1153642 [Hymenopellis radicata]|nr:hypothetical protein BDZ89DRAFT_1153642 [Hymenopellis radicata]
MEVARDSRSTVNCDSNILRLPNEILLLIFDAVKSQYMDYFHPFNTSAAPHRLAAVCRRFRDILVHDLYRVVSLKYSYRPRGRSALIALLPSYGHHIHHLEASAPGKGQFTAPDDAQVSNLLIEYILKVSESDWWGQVRTPLLLAIVSEVTSEVPRRLRKYNLQD